MFISYEKRTKKDKWMRAHNLMMKQKAISSLLLLLVRSHTADAAAADAACAIRVLSARLWVMLFCARALVVGAQFENFIERIKKAAFV